MMRITDDIVSIGVNDHDIDLFEGQYVVPNGMAYNSYVICGSSASGDESIAVMDSVDARFGSEWLAHLATELDGKAPDYLIVQHMEPDHSANITRFMDCYPNATIVASAKAFEMMNNFYGEAYEERRRIVKEGDELAVGNHLLKFIAAPMVHWPEVIMTYDVTDQVVFSADAFGKFGALDVEEDWACEARRYYFGIVGKFGKQVTSVLNKLAQLEVKAICPLHGPMLTDNLDYYVGLYKTWAAYEVETEGVAIAYCSIYGHTKEAAELLERELVAAGCTRVALSDLARDDMAEAVEDAFRYGTLVLASPTYNADMFPFMKEFIDHLADHAYQNRRVALIENGSWAPNAARAMRSKVEAMKGIEIVEPQVSIKSALSDESREQIRQLASALVTSV